MEASTVSAEATARANELYWGSSRSVNQIAEDLDLSKGALYQIIEPLDAGLGCPKCGAPVVYPNRTAKERGLVGCSACAWDGAINEAVTGESSEDAAERPARRDGDGAPAPPPSLPGQETTMRVVVGGALLGAAAGLALVLWARRR